MEAQIKLTREEHAEALKQYLVKIGAIGPSAQIKSGCITEANVHVIFNVQPSLPTGPVPRAITKHDVDDDLSLDDLLSIGRQ